MSWLHVAPEAWKRAEFVRMLQKIISYSNTFFFLGIAVQAILKKTKNSMKIFRIYTWKIRFYGGTTFWMLAFHSFKWKFSIVFFEKRCFNRKEIFIMLYKNQASHHLALNGVIQKPFHCSAFNFLSSLKKLWGRRILNFLPRMKTRFQSVFPP